MTLGFSDLSMLAARAKCTDPLSIAGAARDIDTKMVDTELSDHIPNQFILARHNNNIDTHGEEIRVAKNPSIDTVDAIAGMIPDAYTTRMGSWMSFIISDSLLVKIRSNSNSITIDLLGDKSTIKLVSEKIQKMFDVIAISIEWFTDADLNSVTVPLTSPKGINNSSYPFIEEGVDNFVDEFLQSSETVLMFIGPPGTGKSSLIQYIIAKSKRNAMVTYDPAIMSKDGIFAQFIESDAGSFIMEDADAFLGARTEGNAMMHRFLNVSSGIISMRNKKLIFSTNLDNVDDIDSALLRPGRCFGVVQFRKLSFTESKTFIKEHELDVELENAEYSLAELYNMSKRSRNQTKRKMGFV